MDLMYSRACLKNALGIFLTMEIKKENSIIRYIKVRKGISNIPSPK